MNFAGGMVHAIVLMMAAAVGFLLSDVWREETSGYADLRAATWFLRFWFLARAIILVAVFVETPWRLN